MPSEAPRRAHALIRSSPLALALGAWAIVALAGSRSEVAAQESARADPPVPCGTAAPSETVVLDSGHESAVEAVVRVGDRLLSQSYERWILWNAAAKRRIATGLAWEGAGVRPRIADLVCDTFMVPAPGGFALRSAVDGSVQVHVQAEALEGGRGGLSVDGSYAYVATANALRVWDARGRLLIERAGKYDSSAIFAASSELRIGARSASASFERLAVPEGTVSATRVVGSVVGWFDDGEHFVTAQYRDARIYDRTGVLVQGYPSAIVDKPFPTMEIGGVGGRGRWFWSADPNERKVRVYALGTPSPVLEFAGRPVAERSHRGAHALFRGEGTRLTRLALREPGPVAVPVETRWPEAGNLDRSNVLYAMSDEAGWVIGTSSGTVHFGDLENSAAPAVLGCGRTWALAAADDRLAVASGDRSIRVYAVAPEGVALVQTFPNAAQSKLALAADGRYVLTVVNKLAPRAVYALQVYSVADGSQIHAWPDDRPGDTMYAFSSAARAERVARNVCTGAFDAQTCVAIVSDLRGAELWRTPAVPRSSYSVGLAPGGEFVAVTAYPVGAASSTLVYGRAGLAATFADVGFVSWLDDQRLLMRSGATLRVVDLASAVLTTLTAPPRASMPAYTGPDYYPGEAGRIHRLSDGAQVIQIADRASEQPTNNATAAQVLRGHAVYGIGPLVKLAKLP